MRGVRKQCMGSIYNEIQETMQGMGRRNAMQEILQLCKMRPTVGGYFCNCTFASKFYPVIYFVAGSKSRDFSKSLLKTIR